MFCISPHFLIQPSFHSIHLPAIHHPFSLPLRLLPSFHSLSHRTLCCSSLIYFSSYFSSIPHLILIPFHIPTPFLSAYHLLSTSLTFLPFLSSSSIHSSSFSPSMSIPCSFNPHPTSLPFLISPFFHSFIQLPSISHSISFLIPTLH